MHFMSSNTVELKVRGDESTVCKHAGQYRRRPRQAKNVTKPEREEFEET